MPYDGGMKPESLIEAYFSGIRDGSASLSYDATYGTWSVILAVGKNIIEKKSPQLLTAVVDATSAMDALIMGPPKLVPAPQPKVRRSRGAASD